jgi:membrane-anchored glycerophosphoryl diester phosphodiesterase (GDPDase)
MEDVMESFSRGWSFLKQAWNMAFKDKDLLKPSIYALVTGMVVSVLGVIPIVIVAFLFGGSQIGNLLMGLLGAVLVFAQFMVTYVFSGMTAYLIFGYLSEGDGRLDKAWAIVRRDFFDILTLAAASTFVNILKNAANRRRRGGITAGLLRGAVNLLEVLWTEASYLILPAMVIDDLNLKDAMQRVWNITKQNLLLIGISTVGVRWVTGLIGFVLGFGGFVTALAIAGGAVYVTSGFNFLSILAIAFAAFLFFALVAVASVITSYTSIAYHTCLYIWARDVGKAQAAGQAVKVPAPAPLAAVLA